METYIEQALDMKMLHARIISPAEMVFDRRVFLKCRWGCENHEQQRYKCREHHTGYEERVAMVKSYSRILLLHSDNIRQLSRTAVEIERSAFLDGYHLAFAICHCNFCKICAVDEGNPCVAPLKVRPCEGIFGIDVYRTARRLDLPCYPLKDKNENQNRYAFVCVD